jgi:hypothetical protein
VVTPRPRVNLILYYAVLAPRAAWRAALVPGTTGGALGVKADSWTDAGEEAGHAERRVGGYLWAELMRRAFGVDVLACPRCGGRLRLVALIE